MNGLIVYLAAAFIISLLGTVAMLNFVRYRFKGDKTLLIFSLFILMYVSSVLFTFFLFVPETAPAINEEFFF